MIPKVTDTLTAIPNLEPKITIQRKIEINLAPEFDPLKWEQVKWFLNGTGSTVLSYNENRKILSMGFPEDAFLKRINILIGILSDGRKVICIIK